MVAVNSTTIDQITTQQEINSKTAIIDSGTGMLVISYSSYQTLIQSQHVQSYCKYYESNQIYICYCDRDYPSIIFNGDMKYIVHSENYLAPMQGGICALAVISQTQAQEDMRMVFGDALMRNYFVAYDKQNNQIGFSKPQKPAKISSS
eukprot:TRINITY_DN3901_c0_g1_i2.p1 TRINITY_DN3901_c0_g1~~TRINITY_DN3901_c0_g1_i2.p1  ORF type:complete len:148 (-),score=12.71 TRINITY_DN3901_c0_g1_i2:166-609(-)